MYAFSHLLLHTQLRSEEIETLMNQILDQGQKAGKCQSWKHSTRLSTASVLLEIDAFHMLIRFIQYYETDAVSLDNFMANKLKHQQNQFSNSILITFWM